MTTKALRESNMITSLFKFMFTKKTLVYSQFFYLELVYSVLGWHGMITRNMIAGFIA